MSFKPLEVGCLALIVRAIRHPENEGKTVRVIAHSPDEDGLVWLGETEGEQLLVSNGIRKRFPAKNCWFRTNQLMRIDGGEDETLTTDQEREVSA